MAEQSKQPIFEILGQQFPSTEERLQSAYVDPVVHKRSVDIMHAHADERIVLQAELTVYLAAAHMLFPEESQVIHKSLKKSD